MDNSTVILPEEELKNKDTSSVAQTLYKLGFNVIPLTKELLPSVSYEVYLKQRIPEEIFYQWLSEGKFKNLAIVCGSVSGITVIDIDNLDLFRQSFKTAEMLINSCKFKEKTKSGGLHLYFRYSPFVEGRVIQKKEFGVDVLNKGLSFCSPSSCPEGKYELIEATELVNIPNEFIKEFEQREIYKKLPELLELLQEIYFEGYRQQISLYLVGFLRKAGLTQEKIEQIFEIIWSEFEPNLNKEEKRQRQSAIINTFKKSETQGIKGIAGLQEIAESILAIEEAVKWIEKLQNLFNYKSSEIVTNKDLEEAKSLLKSPDLLDRIVSFFEQSYIGRKKEEKLIYLVGLFTKLNLSTIVIVTGETSSGKSSLIETVLLSFPDEVKLTYTATSERFFLYLNQPLHNKILTIFEINGVTALPFLKTFISEGKASIGTVLKRKGELQPIQIEKDTKGLVIFTTTTNPIIEDAETANRGFLLNLETTPELIREILLKKRFLKKQDFKVLKLVYKLIKPLEVEIPFEEFIAGALPVGKSRILRDYDKIVGLIKASALLHQYQREKTPDGKITATIADYKIVYELQDIIMPAISELTKRQEDFLKWLAPEKTFEETKSYWKEGKANRTTVYRWIKNLISLGYIDETSLGYKVIRNTAVVPALPEPETLINFMQQCNNTAKTVENSKSELLQHQMQQHATKQQMQQNLEQNFNLLQCCKPLQSTMQQSKSSIDKDLSQPVALLHRKSNTSWLDELEEVSEEEL
jgi:hypothetical protein